MFAPDHIDIMEGPAPLPLVTGEVPDGLVLQQHHHAGTHHRHTPSGGGPAGKPRSARQDKLKKGNPANVRNWLKIDQDGETSMVQADKWKLAHKLGVQGRDLRIMDPALATTYPSAILCRERALVVNLEHIKVIITTTSVLVINPEDENVLPFITELKQKLSQPMLTTAVSYPAALNEAASKASASALANRSAVKLESLAALNMPFELKALEVCLDSIASYLNRLASDLEAAAFPALDALTTTVSSNNLERVRRIKGRLVRLTKRVETIREVLEHYLDDDQDMRDMNLSAAEAAEQAALRAAAAKESSGHSDGSAGPTPRSRRSRQSSSSSSSSSSSDDSTMIEEEIAEVEMLLEAYFMHLDNTYNRLQTLNEYIEDTEDLVNLKLDQHRNQLIGIDLMLTSLATALGMMTAVSGYFGMNLDWSGFGTDLFVPVSAITSAGAITLLVAFFAFLWWRRLLIF